MPLVLLASQGDAWLLDPAENLALCLMFRGERMKWSCRDTDRQIGITWDGAFELDGTGFVVTTELTAIGTRAIVGYPLDELRAQLERVQSLGGAAGTSLQSDSECGKAEFNRVRRRELNNQLRRG